MLVVIGTTLSVLGKVGKAIVLLSDAGTKVLSLFKD